MKNTGNKELNQKLNIKEFLFIFKQNLYKLKKINEIYKIIIFYFILIMSKKEYVLFIIILQIRENIIFYNIHLRMLLKTDTFFTSDFLKCILICKSFSFV